MEVIYHYTSGNKMEAILDSGKLIVSPWERSQKIKNPALWLSRNERWEPTAAKGYISPEGEHMLMTMEQHIEYAGGLFRFVLPFHKQELCSWAKYKHVTNQPHYVLDAMEREGVRRGARPGDWFASFKDIPLERVLELHTWTEGVWRPIDPDDIEIIHED